MMKKFTVWIALALLCLGALFTAGCGSDNGQKHIAMVFSHEPNRWTQGAQMMKDALEQEEEDTAEQPETEESDEPDMDANEEE